MDSSLKVDDKQASHTLLSRISSSTAVRPGTILSTSEGVACLLALFVDHPFFHQKHLPRYLSFPPPSLKHKPFEEVYGIMTTEEFRTSLSKQSANRSYLSVPASNMYSMLTSCFNAKSVRCGVCYTCHENYHLAYKSN